MPNRMNKKPGQAAVDKIAKSFFPLFLDLPSLPDNAADCSEQGRPIRVADIGGNPSYWLVPVICRKHLLGFLRLDLTGKLMAYGRYGQGDQLRDFPLMSSLSEETAEMEIRRQFSSDYTGITTPQLIHDGPVDRIAWVSRGLAGDGKKVLLFWSFGTAYMRESKM